MYKLEFNNAEKVCNELFNRAWEAENYGNSHYPSDQWVIVLVRDEKEQALLDAISERRENHIKEIMGILESYVNLDSRDWDDTKQIEALDLLSSVEAEIRFETGVSNGE